MSAPARPLDPLSALRAAVEAASDTLRAGDGGARPKSRPTLDRPPRADFGDYATNAAMLLAPALKRPPRAVAELLREELEQRLVGRLDRVEVAGPGFLNLFLGDAWYREALAHLLAAGPTYGGGWVAAPERILVEFVSANPTGPLTAAGGRHAAYGDALARLLAFAGHEVGREYYVNDFGSQVRRLGESIRARARGEAVPEGGYEGDYVRDLARATSGAADADPDDLALEGVERLLAEIRRSLAAFRVEFDCWFSERSLHAGGPSAVDHAFDELRARGCLYEREGALWLRSTAFGDDKDRVLVRSTGEPTYFTSDIAYHLNKLERGYGRLINVLGADHHGYVGRMKAMFEALGADPDALELLIMQFVNVLERGERASMSKRRGDFITLEGLIGDIGVDAARFFMLQRSHDTMVDLDLDLAREQSAENPVYYVQYAHARIASIRERAGAARVEAALAAVADGRAVPGALHPSERALIKKLLAFPAEAREAAERRAPHRICTYVLELAQEFTAFYRDCRVVGAEPAPVEALRLALAVAAQRVIARGLELLGVSAPEQM